MATTYKTNVGATRGRTLIDRIVTLRQQHQLKLPDAIIAATALEAGATLITEDAQLRKLAAVTSIGIH